MLRDASAPRWGELFAPIPLALLALWVVNDVWLKPHLHNFLSGKLSDVAVCFVMPLFVSELLGLSLALAPRFRLAVGALVTAALFTTLEIVPPVTHATLELLRALGPHLGLSGAFAMTSDPTDLACVPLVVLAYRYGSARLERAKRAPAGTAETPGR